jgi:hypothetical protein
MLVLCYGMQKSGSTLAFELVRTMLASGGFEQPFIYNNRPRGMPEGAVRRNYVQRLNRERIAALIDLIGSERRIAVKTHAPFPDRLFPWLEEQQAGGMLKVVATYRDPRDICLSLLDAARHEDAQGFAGIASLDDAIRYVEACIPKYRKWAALRGTVRLNYEALAFSPEAVLDALEPALGVRCNRAEVLRHVFRGAYTLKNKARPSRHREEMTSEEIARTGAVFAEFLARACARDDQAWYDAGRPKLR